MNVALMVLPAAGGKVDTKSGWDRLIATLEGVSGFGALLNLLTVVGVAIIVFAIGKMLVAKRKGGPIMGGGDGQKLGGAIIAGVIMVAPKVIIPIALFIVDLVINAVIALFSQSGIA